jgi:hypothetical protein
MESLKKGDIVQSLQEYKDGDVESDYILLEDPDGGRVKVMPFSSGLEIPPIQVIKVDWVVKK